MKLEYVALFWRLVVVSWGAPLSLATETFQTDLRCQLSHPSRMRAGVKNNDLNPAQAVGRRGLNRRLGAVVARVPFVFREIR